MSGYVQLGKFIALDKDFMNDVYSKYTEEEKISEWNIYLVFFGVARGHIYMFTPENYVRWKEAEPEIDRFLDILMEEIWEHGYWKEWLEQPDGVPLSDVEREINRRLGRSIK